MLIFALAGCGEFRPATQEPENPDDSPGKDEVVSPPSEDLANDPDAFTVSLRFNGKPYIPKKRDEVIAQWTDGFSFYKADFATDGFARIKGLDGDYKVTLKNLPDGFLYNPNAYVATNDSRNVVIDIYKPIKTTGYGESLYRSIDIYRTGVYRVEIESADQVVYFQYAPEASGTYTVESWMSTAEANYNPKVDVYNGTIAYKLFAYTLDDGGYSDGYTRNFKHIVEIADENFGSTSQAVFTFGVKCDSKNGIYPVYVDFAVQLNGSFSLDHADKELVLPTVELEEMPDYDYSKYEWKWAETETRGVEGRFQFDGKMFKLWAIEDGGDGYYHLYDETKYKGYTDPNGKVFADGYGPVLYAKISSPHRFTEAPFTTIEDAGNSSLTVYGYLNHKLLIEGIEDLLVDPGLTNPQATGGSYFCLRECPCRTERFGIGVCGESCDKCTEDCRKLPDDVMEAMVRPYFCIKKCPCRESSDHDDVCPEGCTLCSKECSNVPKDIYDQFFTQWNKIFPYDLSEIDAKYEGWFLIEGTESGFAAVKRDLMGLAKYTNSDGVYAATEQIKEFLQGFSVSQRYFADGEGWVETHDTYKVDAREADQWLFACGYYLDK